MRTFLIFFILILPLQTLLAQNRNDSDLWKALKSGDTFVMMRHAEAPGIGDPDNFDLEKCSTQRNLSDDGMSQAEDIGRMFRSNGIVRAKIYSSAWCRCIDTGKLLNIGKVQKLTALNSFFRNYNNKTSQMRNLEKWLDDQFFDEPLVLVTHQVNITAFTDVYPESGEMIFIKRIAQGDYKVLGTIETL